MLSVIMLSVVMPLLGQRINLFVVIKTV